MFAGLRVIIYSNNNFCFQFWDLVVVVTVLVAISGWLPSVLYCWTLSKSSSLVGSFKTVEHIWWWTSRDRPKSAPYLRLKNSKRTSKCQSRKKNFKKSFTMPTKTEREDALGFFNIHSFAKLQKNWRGTLWWKNILKKSRTVPKKI